MSKEAPRDPRPVLKAHYARVLLDAQANLIFATPP
jgi:hypothetical protein